LILQRFSILQTPPGVLQIGQFGRADIAASVFAV